MEELRAADSDAALAEDAPWSEREGNAELVNALLAVQIRRPACELLPVAAPPLWTTGLAGSAVARYLPGEEQPAEAPFYLHRDLAADLAASPLRHYQVPQPSPF